jgi:hypothetical protein
MNVAAFRAFVAAKHNRVYYRQSRRKGSDRTAGGNAKPFEDALGRSLSERVANIDLGGAIPPWLQQATKEDIRDFKEPTVVRLATWPRIVCALRWCGWP